MARRKRHPKFSDRDTLGRKLPGSPSPNPRAGRGADQPPAAAAPAPEGTAEFSSVDAALLADPTLLAKYLKNLKRDLLAGMPYAAQRFEQALGRRREPGVEGISSLDGMLWFNSLSPHQKSQLFTDVELFSDLSQEKSRQLHALLNEALGLEPDPVEPEGGYYQQRDQRSQGDAGRDADHEPDFEPAVHVTIEHGPRQLTAGTPEPKPAPKVVYQQSYEGMTYADLSDEEVAAFSADGWRSAPDNVRPKGDQIPSTRDGGQRRESLISGLERYVGERREDGEPGANSGFGSSPRNGFDMSNNHRGPGDY